MVKFHFRRKCPGKSCKVLYVCANHFTPDCLTNKGQFNAGFSQRLILKEGSIPALHEQTSAPDKVSRHASYFVFQIAFLKELLGTLVRLMLLKLPLFLPVFTDAAFTCYQNDRK